MKVAKLLEKLAKTVGKPLADKNSQEVKHVRLAYAAIRDGQSPAIALYELSKRLTPGKALDALNDLLASCQKKKQARCGELPPLEFKPYVPPQPPDLRCSSCGCPVYFYEKQNPPTCLWCEKLQDEAKVLGLNSTEVLLPSQS